jgi:hypothetical protein
MTFNHLDKDMTAAHEPVIANDIGPLIPPNDREWLVQPFDSVITGDRPAHADLKRARAAAGIQEEVAH